MRGLGPELLERVGSADLHSLLMSLWSLLNLQLHEHPLVAPLVAALCKVGVGVRLPMHVGLLVEIALMLQFEAPPQLGLKLPAELCLQAHQAHLRQQQNAAGPPGQMLRGVAAALDALRLRYQLQVCNPNPNPNPNLNLNPNPSPNQMDNAPSRRGTVDEELEQAAHRA